MFFKHPVTYFQAFLNQSSQYYTFIPNLLSLPSRVVVLTEWLNTSETGGDALPLKDISDWLYYSFLWYIPILNLFYSCAFYTNFSILLWIYLLCRKKKKRSAFCSSADQYFGLRCFTGQRIAALRHANDRRRAVDSCFYRF